MSSMSSFKRVKRFGQAQLDEMNDTFELAFRRALYRVSPALLVQYLSLKYRGRLFMPRRARSFEDKLLWLMLYWREPLKTLCADKYAVRSYVTDQGLGHLLPGTLGVYDSAADIDFDRLPDQFVLKCTHGCGFNIMCRDKARFDTRRAVEQLNRWMKVDWCTMGGEIHYEAIKPRIICEVLLDDRTGGSINDYKVHCFGGRSHSTMVCTGRSTGRTRYDFYDLEWKTRLAYCKSSLSDDRHIPKPDAYDEMIDAAEKLSKPFPFVRVDFYSVNGKAFFSEMTFTPHACIDIDLTELAQTTMGDLIVLPKKLLRPPRRGPLPTT